MLRITLKPRVVALSGGRVNTLKGVSGPSDSTVAKRLGCMAQLWKSTRQTSLDNTFDQLRRIAKQLGPGRRERALNVHNVCPTAHQTAARAALTVDGFLYGWHSSITTVASGTERKHRAQLAKLAPDFCRVVACVGVVSLCFVCFLCLSLLRVVVI